MLGPLVVAAAVSAAAVDGFDAAVTAGEAIVTPTPGALDAALTQWPLPAVARELVARNAASLGGLHALRGLPLRHASQTLKLRPALNLSKLGDVAFRDAVTRRAWPEARDRALDLLTMAHGWMHAPRAWLGVSATGSVMMADTLTVLEQADTAWVDAPAARKLGELRSLPIEAVLEGERDAQLAEVERGLKRPALLGEVRADWDRRLAALARRDWVAMDADVPQLPFWQAWLDPIKAETATLISIARPSLRGYALRWLTSETRYQGLRVRLARALYAREHGGQLPPTLGALVPAYLPALPNDPYRPDQPLRYAGGHLWSVGWDGVDDAGLAPVDVDRRDFGQKGDIVLF